MPIPIDHIFFDLNGTLVRGLDGVEKALAGLVPTPRGEILSCLRDDEMLDFLLGRCSEDDYLAKVIAKHSWPIDLPVLKQKIRDNYVVIPGMDRLIRELAEKYPLSLISDQGREWAEYMEEHHDFLQLLTPKFYSFELGIRKTGPEIYRLALERLGRQAARCLFIDDRPTSIAAAAGAGLRTVLFCDSEQVRSELALYGPSGSGK